MEISYHYVAIRFRNGRFDNFDCNDGLVWLGNAAFDNQAQAETTLSSIRSYIAEKIAKDTGVDCRKEEVTILSLTKIQ